MPVDHPVHHCLLCHPSSPEESFLREDLLKMPRKRLSVLPAHVEHGSRCG